MEGNNTYEVPLMADLQAQGRKPEYLFWVGCAGAFDDRYKKVTRAFSKVLGHAGVDYAVLGAEETCTGDPARRAGNEMLFQMQALMVIETLNAYEVKKIITCCPHCYNIFKNEYPDLGGHYEVEHHTVFINNLIKEGKLKLNGKLSDRKVTYHDPCYLGRGNNEYENSRETLSALKTQLVEMERSRSRALCCGAGGAQMFKEAEPGTEEINVVRTREAMETGAGIVATSCPFCMTMITDGIKFSNNEEVKNYDIAELIVQDLGL